MLADSYSRGCYYRRNDYLVDHAVRVVAWYIRRNSGTGYTVRRARHQGIEVLNLYEDKMNRRFSERIRIRFPMLRTGCSPCPVVGGDPWTCRNRGKAATSERSCFDGIRWICGTCVPCRSTPVPFYPVPSYPVPSYPVPSCPCPVLSRLVLSFEADSRSRFCFRSAGILFLVCVEIIRNLRVL